MTTGISYEAIVAQITDNTNSVFSYTAYAITPQQIQWLSAAPAYPACFVSPGEKTAEPNEVGNSGDLRQWITESFSCCVLFANDGDLLGQDAMDEVPLYRETLRKALVNFHVLPQSRTSQPIIEGNDNLFIFEGGARAAWQFNYSIKYQITTDDCYSPIPTRPPLVFKVTTSFTPSSSL